MDMEFEAMLKTEPNHSVSADRLQSEMFARVFQAYLECNDEVQGVIRAMVRVANSHDATDDEREAAYSTIAEALFPSRHDGELGIDLERLEQAEKGESRDLLDEMDREEATFAVRLQAIMDEKNMTQDDLAKAIGVGQSAISMMLSRNCRPQRRTVEKIAGALKVPVEVIWPGFAGN